MEQKQMSTKKAHRKSAWKSFLGKYTLLFMFIFLAAFLPFWKEGRSFIWDVDGIKQHYAVIEYLGNYFRTIAANFFSGNFSVPMYDFSIGMGEDILATLNFYGLGDPLVLLSALVPAAWAEYFYDFLVIFRLYLAGLAFSAYARHRGFGYRGILAGALCYTFSGYVFFTAVRHPFFVAPMMYLPLILIGVDRLIDKKKPWLMIGMIALAALNGFYFLYMLTCFIAVYIIICTLYRYPHNRVRELVGAVLRNIGAYITGILLVGIVFLPVIAGYLGSMRSGTSIAMQNPFVYEWEDYQEMFISIIAPQDTWDFPGMAAVGLLSFVFLYTPLGKRWKQLRWGMGIAAAFMVFPAGGYILNGFSYRSGRWMFMLCFLLALTITAMLPSMLSLCRKKKYKALVVMGIIAVVYLDCFLDLGEEEIKWTLLGLQALTATILVLWIPVSVKLRYWLLMCVIGGQLVLGGFSVYDRQEYGKEFVAAGTAHDYLSETPLSLLPMNTATDFYRVDAAWKPTENAAMVTGQYGISGYFSIVNPNLPGYMEKMRVADIYDIPFKINGMDSRTAMMELANVKYFAASEEEQSAVPYGYVKTDEKVLNGTAYGIYENKMALPLGYTYDSYMTEAVYNRLEDLQKQEAMLQCAMVTKADEKQVQGAALEEKMPVITTEEIPFTVAACENLTYENGVITVKERGGSITLAFASPAACETYIAVNSLKIPEDSGVRSCYMTMYGGGQETETAVVSKTWNWYNGRENYLFNLGYHEESLTTCKIVFSRRGTYEVGSLGVYAQPMTNYESQTADLREEAMTDYELTDDCLTGTITVRKDKLLCLGIPYSLGWSAKVDGKETELFLVNELYTGMLLTAGTHNIQLVYRTPFFMEGIAATAAGICILIGIGIRYGRKARKEKKDAEVSR